MNLAELATRLAGRVAPPPEDLTRDRAAVAVILAPAPDSVLLIQRAERADDRWSGHLALPGGRVSPRDPDLAATAKRETLEEVGIDLSGASLLGVLDDLEPRTPILPPLLVRPFVFALAAQTPPRPNQEVAGAWWVPLSDFRAEGSYGPMEYRRYGTLVRSMGYHLEHGVLWGLTERILTPLLNSLS